MAFFKHEMNDNTTPVDVKIASLNKKGLEEDLTIERITKVVQELQKKAVKVEEIIKDAQDEKIKE